MKKYRNELKFLVNEQELALIRHRLTPVMKLDQNQEGDFYHIRSMYFDDYHNSCMEENEAGIDNRKKYRIRIYNRSSDKINLEVKSKLRGLTNKESCQISLEECRKYMAGEVPPRSHTGPYPMKDLYARMRMAHMRPVSIVEYERTAFIERTGNVRVTFDRNIAASGKIGEFLENGENIENSENSENSLCLIPVLPPGQHILEVKYDEFLPEYIGGILEIGTLRRTSFSKYYLSRVNAI